MNTSELFRVFERKNDRFTQQCLRSVQSGHVLPRDVRMSDKNGVADELRDVLLLFVPTDAVAPAAGFVGPSNHVANTIHQHLESIDAALEGEAFVTNRFLHRSGQRRLLV